MTPGAPTRGVLFVDGVQLHDLVEASPFGDKVDLDAKVSGRIAFESSDGKVRVSEGELIADQPGRISIDRTALTGVQADGAVTTTGGDPAVAAPANANDTFTDFAYQAMEHLAFDTLEATVASRADGRLGGYGGGPGLKNALLALEGVAADDAGQICRARFHYVG